MALIAAVSWHFGSTRARASKSASRADLSILPRNQHGERCSRQNRRGAANPSISPKTWQEPRFPRQIRRGPVRT